MSKLFFASISTFLFNVSIAYTQENKFLNKDFFQVDKIFVKNHISFTAKPLLFENGKIVGDKSPFNPSSNSRFGFEAGFNYLMNKNKNTSFITGLQVGFAPRNFTFSIPQNYLAAPYDEGLVINGGLSNMFPLFYASIPITFEKRVFKEKNFVYFGGGIILNYALMFSIDEYRHFHGFPATKIVTIEENWQNKNNFFVQANANFGYGFVLKNYNIFKIGFVTNIALHNLSTANYNFTPPLLPNQQGEYNTRSGFIGLSFSYVLTKTNNVKN